ncbi:peptidoglycan-associated lipoprotein Pal [Tropicibacter naphthalenivorans]|uniref:Peptidoglycan-associated lipoprotein n=1 Tax=Tropicibacter naphthalenivorans TaxID=441103 RepID=A0A0P1GSQ6_9RHOB|nr:peptidoglycan-associated lipoprotein Pal [Tropicibacter naphthalenivorans]CUH78192.1 Minor outer membrane protein Omp16 [Tropicibacter naphthalenivorans]SMC78259.1 peptidoglycan-associated lipoprotein [Tropicibacter naphthalenivorans]
MKLATKAVLLVAALGLAACTNPNRFDNADAGALGPNAGGANAGFVPGSVDDPTSTAYFTQRVGDRVLFAVDQSTLSPEARTVLDGQAQWLLTNSDYLAIIEGHADEQGTREYNLALGARRANSVMEYLVSKGVPSSRLKFISYGKERPIEICSEESCYAKNRRAVTVISASSLTG